MAGEFPALSSVFVGERDIFLTHSLQMAADSIPQQCLGPNGQRLQSSSPNTVVGVVGIGHTPGIAAHWGQVSQDQVRAVVQVDPPSTASRILTFTVRTAMYAGCLYGVYRSVIHCIPLHSLLVRSQRYNLHFQGPAGSSAENSHCQVNKLRVKEQCI